jgi:hypothetical protein
MEPGLPDGPCGWLGPVPQIGPEALGNRPESHRPVERVRPAQILRREQLNPAAARIPRRTAHTGDQRPADSSPPAGSIDDQAIQNSVGNTACRHLRNLRARRPRRSELG